MVSVRLSKVSAVWRKELLDIIRDKRTLISMIVVPILLMPVLMIGGGLVAASAMKSLQEKELVIGTVHPERSSRLENAIAESDQVTLVDLTHLPLDTIRARIETNEIQAAVVFPEDNVDSTSLIPSVTVLFREDREKSNIAAGRITRSLEDLSDEMIEERMVAYNVPESVITPFEIVEENLATDEQMILMALASFLPYILILITFTGALYPAIDMTAGEKERGTLETLLASPASRLEIVFGKFFAVFTTSVTSGVLSVLSLMVAVVYGASWLGASVGTELNVQMDAGAFLGALAMMLPLAALFSSILLTVCVFAKSTREAQSYVQPLVFLLILPAMMSMMPGSESTMSSAWTPVVNVSLAVESLLTGQSDPAFIGITLLSTTIYAMLGIMLTARVFQKETALFRV
ncbi:MAG TPA: ABC transporter permease [Bacteroidetes bacterium]|nr:inner membrane transport permease YbhR [bacterium BMS3Bbin04]HDO66058.1 ABC transporter permease [Bacteroidota bacterium]HEX05183.1 ABC transporter permease [Bacteroidota bacterium]